MTLLDSRPLRALAVLLLAWVGVRAWFVVGAQPAGLAPMTLPVTQVLGATAALADAEPRPTPMAQVAQGQPSVTKRAALQLGSMQLAPKPVPTAASSSVDGLEARRDADQESFLAASEPSPAKPLSSPPRQQPLVLALPDHRLRFQGSAWLLARSGSGSTGLAPQLGGAQTGARVYLPVAGPLALTGQASSALATNEGHVAAGVALRGRNAGLIVEHRFRTAGGGRNALSVTGYAGFSQLPLAQDVMLDGYAQVGVVGGTGFADGALRLERTVLAQGPLQLSAGAGLWGAAQTGAARLDIGPQLVARLPLGERTARASVEWRQRIAGNASPASGPTFTMGIDF